MNDDDLTPGCKRTDNLSTIKVQPTDPVDHAAVQRVLPILIQRHAFCVPSAECMSDALSRENL